MSSRTPDSIAPSPHTGTSLGRALHESLDLALLHELTRATRGLVLDLPLALERVLRRIRRPTRRELIRFLGNQLLVNAVAWCAAILVSHAVQSFFEVRSYRNLWGLMSSGQRSLVSVGEYERLVVFGSYGVGLLILILVRRVILCLVDELRALRRERRAKPGVDRFDADSSTVPLVTASTTDPLGLGRRLSSHPHPTRRIELALDDPADDGLA